MTISAQDQDAAIDLLVEGYQALQRKDRRNDLLKYVTEISETKVRFADEHFNEFWERFSGGKDSLTYACTSYFTALDNALGQVEDRANGTYEMAEDVLLPF